MIEQMTRFQKIMEQATPRVDKFWKVHDDPDVAHAMNYILLASDHYALMLYQLHVVVSNVDRPEWIKEDIASVSKKMNTIFLTWVVRRSNKRIVISHDTRFAGYIKDMEYTHRRMILYSLIRDRFSNISVSSPEAQIFTKSKSMALELLNQDLSAGYLEFIRLYVMHYRTNITEMIDISNENGWYDLTMTILRICHDEGIITDSGAALSL